MATQISPANGLQTSNFVANTSRYIDANLIYWGDKKVLTYEVYKRKPFIKKSSDKFLVVSVGEEYRPDLIAKRAYGINLIAFWWKIMEANNIFDVFDLKAGKTLRIPAIVG